MFWLWGIVLIQPYIMKKQRSKQEEHHVIPISMKWSDHESNKEMLSYEDHKLVHNKLNIDYQLLRTFRKKSNERTIFNWERSSAYHKLWRKYFSDLDELPEHLVQVHNKSFSNQNSRARKQVLSLSKILDIPAPDFHMDAVDYHWQDAMKYGELIDTVEWKLNTLIKLDKARNDLFLAYYAQEKPNLGSK